MPEQLGLFGSFPCGGWSISNANLTSNSTAVLAPDGTATADDVTSTAAGAYLQDVVADPAQYDNATLTASVYLCVPSGTPSINLHIYNQNPSGITAIATQSVALSSAWQRFSLTGTAANGLMKLYLQIGDSTSFPSGETVYVWGAQMVMGSSAGAPIQTVNTTTSDANGATVYLAANGMNESYSYDPFGNMVSSGNFNFQQAYTTANQLVGWSYDASGNLLTDAFNKPYTYDAEGRLSVYAGNNYVYDADGNRVEKNGSVATDYIYFGGQQLARLSAGQWTDLIYGPTGLLAEVPGTQSGPPVYRMLDQLGTQVGTLSSTGVQLSSTDYAPFGQLFAGGTTDPYQFTGKERDSESGNDYFGARYYASSMGRFMSPDWADFPDAVPWANTDNPQSLNLYSYVQNNPLSNVDDDGHDCVVQSRTSNTTETVTTSAGNCDNVSVGDGQTKTYVPGTVTGISVNGGNSIDIGYNSYDGQSSGVTNAGGAPIPDNPGLAYNWGNNAQGYATLGAASKAVNYATIGVAVTFGAVGGAMVAGDLLAGEGLTTLAGENGFDLMGNRALNRAIGDAQRKILDDLFLGKGGPEGLTPRTIKIYIEVAKRAIAAGKDSLGVQAARLNLLQNLLK